MINIASMPMNPFGENTYILYNDARQAIVIDAGMSSTAEKERFAAFVAKNKLEIVLALNTHAHIDHICGVQWVKDTFSVPFALHAADLPVLQAVTSYAEGLGFHIDEAPTVDRQIIDGELIRLGSQSLKVIHTPGHTAGGVCFWIEDQKMLLTGDTLFRESIGRTDLPTGDYDALMRSIVGRILPLGSDVEFFPGHGPKSTVGYEMERNPFITEVMSGDAKFKAN
ncbi:MAG: MBL fold metallo-hydrolase [Mucinivorans sp.]